MLQIIGQEKKKGNDTIVREFSLSIFFNNQELVTLACSPSNLEHLVAGFLFSEGFVKGKHDLNEIVVDYQRGVAKVTTKEGKKKGGDFSIKRLIASSGGKGISFFHPTDSHYHTTIKSQIKISTTEIFALMDEFVQRSKIFQDTGGVHSAALCDKNEILLFREDIGRHNAIDKIFGECILKNIQTDERIILTSGRVSSEILLKVSKRNIPLLVSKSAPTDMGVQLAGEFGMTLIGFARGERMNIYTHEYRVM